MRFGASGLAQPLTTPFDVFLNSESKPGGLSDSESVRRTSAKIQPTGEGVTEWVSQQHKSYHCWFDCLDLIMRGLLQV